MRSEFYKIKCCYRLLLPLCLLLVATLSAGGKSKDSYFISRHFSAEDSIRITGAYNHYANHPNADSSLDGLKSVLADCQALSFNSRAIWTANKLGNLHSDRGNAQQAIAYYKMAIEIAKKQGGTLTPYLSTGYNNIANIYAAAGNYSQSARMYFKALLCVDYYGTVLHKESILINLSHILIQLGQYHQAHFHLNHAEYLVQLESNPAGLANIYMTRGIIEARKKNFPAAISHLQKALTIARENKLKDLIYTINCNLADNFYNQGNLEEAVPYLKELLTLKDNVAPYYTNQADLLLGKYYLNSGKYPQAEETLLRAMSIAESQNYAVRIPMLHDLLSDLYKATGRPEMALKHKEEYFAHKDSLESRQTSWKVNQMEVKYRTLEKDKQITENRLYIKDQKNKFRQQHLLLQVGIVGICFFSFFIFVIYRINLKKKEKQLSLLQNEQSLLQQKEISLIQAQEILQLKAIIEGEERERSRIARDLHDGLGGTIAAIRLNLGAAIRKQHSVQQEAILEETELLIRDMAAEVRNIAHNLVPKNLLDKSLEEALLTYQNAVNNGDQLHMELHTYGDFASLSNDAKLGIYRIIQELVQNIIKHAMATTATIQILRVKDSLRITIEDDGHGFDQEETKEGIGLNNVKLRVHAMLGNLIIQSDSNRGTTIYIEFNFEQLTINDDVQMAIH